MATNPRRPSPTRTSQPESGTDRTNSAPRIYTGLIGTGR
jgi:hypothetical protein